MASKSEARHLANPFADYVANQAIEENRDYFIENIRKLLRIEEENSEAYRGKDSSVYTGSAGIALLYWHLSEALGDNRMVDTSLSIITSSLRHLNGRDYTFLCGDSGALTIAAIIYNRKNNKKESDKHLHSLKSMVAHVLDIDTKFPDEILYGRAGFLYSLLLARKCIEDCDKIITDSDIRSTVEAIIRSGKRTAERESNKLCALMYYWHNTSYVGAAHGLTGIMFMLLQAKQYLTSEELNQLVKPTIDFILSLRFPSGNYPSSLENSSDRLIHWCHGSPGTVHLFALAYQIFGEQRYLNAAKECADVIWSRGILKKGYGICHGTAGNGYAFLKLYKITDDQKYLYRALKFGEWCCHYGEHGCRTPDRPFSLYEGLAGTIYYLSDLLNPKMSNFPAFDLI